MANQNKKKKPPTSSPPAAPTPSFYTAPTNETNYETGRPVYAPSQAVTEAGRAAQAHQAAKPADYESAWAGETEALIRQILGQPAFRYDAAEDPLYQQYAQRYEHNGRLAMKGAMAEGAALTGGYGSSYAQQAGQQAYQQHLSQLDEVLPTLYEAAYRRYQDEDSRRRQNLGLLQAEDDRQYGRHRDEAADWRTDRDFLFGAWNSLAQQEYQRFMNDQSAWQNDRDYWYRKGYDAQQQANWQAEFNLRSGEAAAKSKGGGSGKRKKKSSTPLVLDGAVRA